MAQHQHPACAAHRSCYPSLNLIGELVASTQTHFIRNQRVKGQQLGGLMPQRFEFQKLRQRPVVGGYGDLVRPGVVLEAIGSLGVRRHRAVQSNGGLKARIQS